MEEKKEILLKEYEVCQSDAEYNGNIFWITMSIVISANVAAFGWVVSKLSGGLGLSINNVKIVAAQIVSWPIIPIGIGMIIILLVFYYFLKRLQLFMTLANDRMLQIEREINKTDPEVLKKTRWIRGLDSYYGRPNRSFYEGLEESQRYEILSLSREYQKQPCLKIWKWFMPHRKGCNKYVASSRPIRAILFGVIILLWVFVLWFSLYNLCDGWNWTWILPASIVTVIAKLVFIYGV